MSSRTKPMRRLVPAIGLSGALCLGLLGSAAASSHREAPLIAEDPVADLTDLYAFVTPNDSNTVTLIMNAIPFEKPDGGPNFYRFGDDVMYAFNIDNNGDGHADKQFSFRFSTNAENDATFLYNTGPVRSLDDPNLNLRQIYTVTETDLSTGEKWSWGNNPVAPANIGPRSTPDYDKNLGAPAVRDLGYGYKAFAGPRDDPFFADLGSIFDLGGLRPLNQAHLIPLPTDKGKDGLAGYNVHSIVLQVPKSALVADDPTVGIWATTSRRSERVLRGDGTLTNRGKWVQVSRLGMPLVNEVVIPMGMKDRFNASQPADDMQFAANVLNPELANLIPVLYPGVQVPKNVDAGLGLGGREDIATIFLTGIPGLNQPANVKPAEMLRLNTSMTKSSFPNGRTLTDDVVDIELQALAGNTAFTPEFQKAPNNVIGDGVSANDKAFTATFPYLASPVQGY
ncbi:MAG: DUF4331 domain-containing protein [Acidimicrobiia bacterium]